mgnify:CR=1 FL=1
MVSIKNLKKSFGSNEVLKDISIDIKAGEIVSVLGPSGSGKSTFIRCINLLEKPTSGEIWFEGCELTGDNKENLKQMRERIGMVFQQFNLFMHMTVLKNIMYAPVHVLKVSKQQAREDAMELLKLVGLEDKADVYPATLSGGQQQRVAIARTLAMKPDLLLFDEPTSALDPEMVNDVLDVIKGIAKKQKNSTMVIVTHEMAFAREVSSRILFLDGGYVVEDEPPEVFFNDPKSQRAKDFLAKML